MKPFKGEIKFGPYGYQDMSAIGSLLVQVVVGLETISHQLEEIYAAKKETPKGTDRRKSPSKSKLRDTKEKGKPRKRTSTKKANS